MSITCKNASGQTIDRLYQWDVNYEIYITGVDMSSTPLFHFCNRRSKIAYVVAPVADNNRLKATIPNALLAEPDTIFLYLYYNGAGDAGRTVYVISFPVVPRQKPQNYAAIDNYLSIEMIDQAIMEYIAEGTELITEGLVSRVTALESSTGDMSDEIVDARTGYDDTEYESVGEHIRSIGVSVSEIETVHDVHTFASQTEYNNNIDPIYAGDFIIIANWSTGEKRLMFKQKDDTITTLVSTEGFYKLPVNGIPLSDLSDEVQAMIEAGGDGDITINSGHATFGFYSTTAYETFISDYPDAIQDGDYIWINESTPTTKKYVLYRSNSTAQSGKEHVFTINNTLYITVSIVNNELVSDTTLAQIRQALTQNRDLVLITETGVPIELSDISYSGGVASEVQFTGVTYNGVCHILTTYIIDGNGLTTKSQNLTLAGVKDIIVRGPVTGGYEILSIPDVFSNLSEVIDGATQGLDIRMTVVHDPHYYRVSRHPFTTILEPGDTMVFVGYESVDEDGYNKTVLATYSVSPSDQYVTRTEYHIDNDDVPSGGGSGTKTTWYGTCSTATSTAAKTVSLSGYTLETGSIVNIMFENAVNANATLNINSTGAKSIYHKGAAINGAVIGAGTIATLFYDGSHYCLIGIGDWYVKPSGGIPWSDLSSDLMASIGKADTALQPGDLSGYATQSWVNSALAPSELYLVVNGTGTDGDPVACEGTYVSITTSFQSNPKMISAFVVMNGAQLDHVIAFASLSTGDYSSSALEFSGIAGKKLYSVVITPTAGQNNMMSGLLSVTDLAIPVVDNENF